MARPRTVTEGDALERALRVFWEQGYDRTSVADLSGAIGVGASSIYNSFGSKLEIYTRSIELYMNTHAGFAIEILGPDSKNRPIVETITELLERAVELYTSKDTPRGCAMFESAGAGGVDENDAQRITEAYRASLESTLSKLFRARRNAGETLAESPKVLAQSIVGTLRGLSQHASDGAKRSDLIAVARHTARGCVA